MRLIDADALIQNHFSDEHRIALSYADKLWMRTIISDEPTIDAVPVVHGEWIIKTNYKTPVSHAYIRKEKLYICPYCGKDYRQHMNFCGNCGAKMDGERAEETL